MSDIYATIARVRRAMPRNADVMALCEDWDRQQTVIRELERKANKPPFDRKTYMKSYMRRYRRKAEKRERENGTA